MIIEIHYRLSIRTWKWHCKLVCNLQQQKCSSNPWNEQLAYSKSSEPPQMKVFCMQSFSLPDTNK